MPQEFDVVCLGGGVAGEAHSACRRDRGAIKLGTPLKTLADVIHPFPAFNRVLGAGLEELATKVAPHSATLS